MKTELIQRIKIPSMVLFLIRVLMTDLGVKGSSKEGFTWNNVVIHQLTLIKTAQLGCSVAALTLFVFVG